MYLGKSRQICFTDTSESSAESRDAYQAIRKSYEKV